MRLDGTYFEQLWVGQVGLDLLWGGALAAVPLALGVWVLCRFGRIRPATRHMLWVVVLVSLVTPMIGGMVGLPRLPIEAWLGADQGDTRRVERSADNAPRPSGQPLAQPLAQSLARPLGQSPSRPLGQSPSRLTALPPARLDERDLERLRTEMGLDRPVTDPATTSTLALMPPLATATSPIDVTPAAASTGDDDRVASAKRLARSEPPTMTTPTTTTPPTMTEPVAPVLSATQRIASRAGGAIRTELGRWGAAFVSVRDAVGTIPPIPAGVWGGGIVAVLVWRLVQVVRFRRALRTGTPAPARVQAQVRTIAAEVGLSRLPKTVMLDRRVSPFVWCGWRPVLVLPVGLWGELDREGQRAVLMHELAHLRRRDHLVVWLSQAVSLVYWWHPVVWWARRQIEEEADFACDAWVTALRPSGRRVYAETLVVAKSYVSGPGLCRIGGLPMASRSARQLSRRLTMVMTQRKSPGLSALGVVLAAGVAAVGVFVTPSLACPEDERAATPQPDAPPIVGFISRVPAAPTYPTGLVSAVPAAPTPFDLYQPGLATDDPELIELLKRIEQLEKALKELRHEAKAKASTVRGRIYREETAVAKDKARAPRGRVENLRRETRQMVELERELAAEAQNQKHKQAKALAGVKKSRARLERHAADLAAEAVQTRELYEHLAAEKARNRGSVTGRARPPQDARTPTEPSPPSRAVRPGVPSRHAEPTLPTLIGGDEVQVSYTLSSGKLDALTELMARQDVPIVIARGDDSITVFGTKAQQKVFAAFVKMIDPGKGARAPGLRMPQRAAPLRTRSGRHSAIEAENAAVKEAYAKYARGYTAAVDAAVDAEKVVKADQAKLKAYEGMLKAEQTWARDNLDVRVTPAQSLRLNAERIKARAQETQALLKNDQRVRVQEQKIRAMAKELEARAAAKAKGHSKRETDVLHKRIAELEAKAAKMAAQATDLKRKIEKLSAPRDE